MTKLTFRINGNPEELLHYEARLLINAGYTGRNQDEVQKHIEELKKLGIPAPDAVPVFFPKFTDKLSQEEIVPALDKTAHIGEAEYVLICTANEVYVGVGSDHTDRSLEQVSIPKAKQMYPNVISRDIWRLTDVENHWDNIMLRSWVEQDGQRILYQETSLAALMAPSELLPRVKELISMDDTTGLVVYSGTVGAKVEIDYSPCFETELADAVQETTLRCSYRLAPVEDWFKGKL